jgi:hypothetical protein
VQQVVTEHKDLWEHKDQSVIQVQLVLQGLLGHRDHKEMTGLQAAQALLVL